MRDSLPNSLSWGVIPAFCEREFEIEIPPEARVGESWTDESGRVFEEWEISIPIEGAKADLLVVVKDRETKNQFPTKFIV